MQSDGVCSYTSTPLKASLIVLVCTSVMVVILIDLVITLMMFGCTRPRAAKSWNSVMGPSLAMGCSVSACAAAICCHLVLWWKPAVVTLVNRLDGMRNPLTDRKEDARRALDGMAAAEKFLESVAGHLRSAPNMMGVRGSPRRVLGRQDSVLQSSSRGAQYENASYVWRLGMNEWLIKGRVCRRKAHQKLFGGRARIPR